MSWPMVKLGDLIIDDIGGVSFKREQFSSNGTPVVPKKAISGNVLIDNDDLVYTPSDVANIYGKYFLDDSFLLTTFRDLVASGPNLGRVCEINVGQSFLMAQGMYAFKLNEHVYPRYFCYFSAEQRFREQVLRSKVGSTQVHIRGSEFRSIQIPLPPLAEQKRIAAILDKADAIRRKRQQAIQLADDFLRAVFLDMFGDPVTNPKGWEVKPVGDLCDCIVPGRDKPKSFNGSTPWITTNELIHLGVTFKKENYIGLTVDEISEVKARVVRKKSVIMTCVGDLGVVSVAGEDMVINQQLHAFLPSQEIAPSYLSFSLALQKGYMLKMASSTTLPYMNKTVCNSVPVMLSPKEMQEKFESLVAKVAAFKLKSTDFSYEVAFQSISQKAFRDEL